MKGNSGYHTFYHLIHHRGWTEELIAAHLGEPDMVQTYPNKPASRPVSYFLRSRVDEAEKLDDVAAVVIPRQAELSQSRADREAQKAKIMREAADAAEIVVEQLPLHEVKIRGIEAVYEENGRQGRDAPTAISEEWLSSIAFKFAVRRLVDYDRIIAALPAPLDKPEVYELCRERIDAAVIALYPEIAPPVEQPLAAEDAAQVEPGEADPAAPPAVEEPAPSAELKPSQPDTGTPPPIDEPA